MHYFTLRYVFGTLKVSAYDVIHYKTIKTIGSLSTYRSEIVTPCRLRLGVMSLLDIQMLLTLITVMPPSHELVFAASDLALHALEPKNLLAYESTPSRWRRVGISLLESHDEANLMFSRVRYTSQQHRTSESLYKHRAGSPAVQAL